MKRKSINKDLFVSDISFDVVEEDLQKLFAVCGTVRSIHMITDAKNGNFKGVAFVRMSTAAEAKDALHMLDGTRLIDRCISVKEAKPKTAVQPVVEEVAKKAKKPRRPRGQGLKRQR